MKEIGLIGLAIATFVGAIVFLVLDGLAFTIIAACLAAVFYFTTQALVK